MFNESILIVEDDVGVAILEQRALSRHGFSVTCVTNIEDALAALNANAFDLIVSDYQLEFGTGLELLSKVHSLGLEIPVILVTGFSDESTIIAAMRGGAHDFVPKTSEYLQYLPEAVERVLMAVRTERELTKSKARFQLFMDHSPAAAFIKDEAGRLIYANRLTQETVGREDWLGKSDFELWPEDVALQLRANDVEVLTKNKSFEAFETVELPNGETRHFRTFKFPMLDTNGDRLLGGMAVDVTQQRKTEEALQQRDEQLRQSQKMEAIGTLAGGVAHEFNNLLQVVLGYTRFAMASIEDSNAAQIDLGIVVTTAERAAQLTQQLLSFSRREPGERMPLNVNVAIYELTAMLRPLIGAQISIELALDQELAMVLADHGEVQQMLMNLCINARDSMPDGGKITISTHEVTIDSDNSHLAVPRLGSYLAIRVSDTGCGMSAEVKQKIFEPFFTTKPVGKGTGLGLAMVFSMVQSHGGAIQVDSEIGTGTVFTLYLPLDAAAANTTIHRDSDISSQDSGTILLTDDEPMVLDMTKRMLESIGYRVISAVDGLDAVRLFREYVQEIDLVILDLVTPNLNGWEAVQEIRKLHPSAPAILTTGCDRYLSHTFPDGIAPRIVRKPFVLEDLLEAIQEVIERKCPCPLP
ncbi:MAG TPA: response regulator [Pirellula sp.]|nr:response regulator [Pirellula sp.]